MEKIYTPSQFANMINVTVKTLQRWDRKNILIAHRTITNRRYYTHTQYCEYMGIEIKKATKWRLSNSELYRMIIKLIL